MYLKTFLILIFLKALVCIWSESKNTFNITMSGSGDLLTNRVSRQTVCVGARMWVYFMFMWVAAISLTKGALIDTFGTLAGRAELGAASRHKTSLCLTTGYTTQRPLPSQNTAKYHNQTFNWATRVQSPCAQLQSCRTRRSGQNRFLQGFAQFCTAQSTGRAAPTALESAVRNQPQYLASFWAENTSVISVALVNWWCEF